MPAIGSASPISPVVMSLVAVDGNVPPTWIFCNSTKPVERKVCQKYLATVTFKVIKIYRNLHQGKKPHIIIICTEWCCYLQGIFSTKFASEIGLRQINSTVFNWQQSIWSLVSLPQNNGDGPIFISFKT
jgi:hypothetical protein